MTYGVTSTGFVKKPESVIRAELLAEFRARIHPGLSDSPDTVSGQLIGIMAAKQAEAYERDEANYNSVSPNASGNALDRVCRITGTKREGPTYSTVTAQVTIEPGTYAAGTIAATVDGDPDARFVSTEDVTNSGGSAASFDVAMQADTTGPVRAPSGQLTVLDSPPAGVNSITNGSDADLGSDTEDDPDLRVRREEELEGSGAATLDAIRADVARVDGVTDCKVYTNRTSSVDADLRPAKSFEVVALGGDDDAIAQAIWDSYPAGIESYSASGDSGTAEDEEGNDQEVDFTRPTDRRIYARVTLTRDADDYAGDDAVKTTIADFTDGDLTITASNGNQITGEVPIGGSVRRSKISAAVLTVPGVTSVTSVELSTDGSSWASADYNLTVRQYLGTSPSTRGIQTADITLVVS